MHGELRAKRDALEHLWRRGLSGKELLRQHCRLIDEYVTDCFNGCPAADQGMSLAALGGYGRGELFPFSDIDLLLLHGPETEEKLQAVTEAVFYPLWDAGLEVGHGVRTPEECIADAGEDFFLQVALLDMRPLAGENTFIKKLREDFQKTFIEGHRRDFLQKMLHFRTERHNRFGKYSYQLEPHIKESPGGFRDIQAMLWTAQAVFGLRGLDAIENAGLLSALERQKFETAWDYLIRIRNRLHYASGRKNDQLYFEHQEEMAQAFKHRGGNGLLGVEQFMRKVHGHMHAIAVTTGLFFEQVDESLNSTPGASAKDLEPGIAVRNGRIQLTDPELLAKRPYVLMRLFAQSAHTGLPLHSRTRKFISGHLHLLDKKLRRSKRMAKAFLESLQEAEDPLEILSSMLETGLLPAYIPEMKEIESLAQHDVYHVYTVDHHLLHTVAEITKLRDRDRFFEQIASPHILYLAALLHDIGKGHRDDHSARGAQLVKAIGERLGLSRQDIDSLAFLVANHLFLMITAQRRDLDDEGLILQCARRIADPDRLRMLYLLSIADAKATGPTAWNEWKGALLLELYLKIAHLLDRKDLGDPDEARAAAWMKGRTKELLDGKDHGKLSELPAEYLLNFRPETIVRHIGLSRTLKRKKTVLEHEDQGSYWSVLIMAPDRTGLLAKICGTLAFHNLDVVAAQVFTWDDGTAVDVLHVRSAADLAYEAQDWQALEHDLGLALKNRLGLAHRLVGKYPHRLGARQVGLLPAPRVVFDNDASGRYTIIEVYAANLPGLLYHVTRTLADFDLNICRAKIGTARDQAVDVFYTLGRSGGKITDPPFQEEIRQALLYVAEAKNTP